MANKKKKYQNGFQILLIPDDQSEPKAITIPANRTKLAKIIAVALAVHVVVGFFTYWRAAQLHYRNRNLTVLNDQLNENNQKVYELLAAFEELEASQGKIRSALGLASTDSVHVDSVKPQRNIEIYTDFLPAVVSPYQVTEREQQVSIEDKLGFLQRSTASIHDYLKSVPTFLPVEGILTSDYDDYRHMDRGQHRGIDIAAPRGSFIRAAADGIVVFAGWTPDLGDLIILYHGDGFFSYYGHNQRLLYKRSALVKKGEPIAFLGNTGQSSAPHLHFEIWKDGVPQDPKEFILAFSKPGKFSS
ncbi:MAG TPA: M23 family metallopeptidase [bacterium]|jgi:murein DD-endopeptidase MepM/ murein hydrolase activator NlpD|nr:M23 family metallopeptidase [bacterium]HNT64750.1 M23 family metallopeptidase [bacterium]HOX85911.1 M23 family metallopeptidase [bacterium]HPG45106.1 M23 family metallopeptidase [bacterium]HPM97348.1 M23 family metallopeptidase [bacterium]